MSNDLSIPRQDPRSADAVTLERGSELPAGGGGIGRLLERVGRDRRLAPVLGGLGVVAAFASLAGEWTIMTVPNAGPEGNTPVRVPAGVSEVGNFGGGYLVGLFGVLGCLSLALFGSASIRRNARVLGLTFAGGLLALLVAATASLDEAASRLFYYGPVDGFRVDYGRGLVMAFVAAGLLGLALLAAGRAGAPAGDYPADPAGADGGPAGAGEAGPPGQRRRSRGWLGGGRPPGPEADARPAPADLTVTAAPPIIAPHRASDG